MSKSIKPRSALEGLIKYKTNLVGKSKKHSSKVHCTINTASKSYFLAQPKLTGDGKTTL